MFTSGVPYVKYSTALRNNRKPAPSAARPGPSPVRVLRGQDVAFGVRHKAQDPAAGVADPSNFSLRAVWVNREIPRPALPHRHTEGQPGPIARCPARSSLLDR